MARHPGDARNERAIASLAAIARTKYSDVEPATWEALAPHVDSGVLKEAINQANRAVGFTSQPSGFDDYAKSVAAMAEAYAQPVAIGGAQ